MKSFKELTGYELDDLDDLELEELKRIKEKVSNELEKLKKQVKTQNTDKRLAHIRLDETPTGLIIDIAGKATDVYYIVARGFGKYLKDTLKASVINNDGMLNELLYDMKEEIINTIKEEN